MHFLETHKEVFKNNAYYNPLRPFCMDTFKAIKIYSRVQPWT